MKYISIVFIICSSLVIAGERTGTSYFLNAGLNYNMHTTDIKGFSGTENCCDEFTGGNFLDPTFGFGMQLSLGKLLFDIPTSYVLQLNYNGMSSEYNEERFRGYKINEFDKQPIMVEHQLNPTIKLLSVGNSIYSELFNGFSFGVGADIGLAITSDFSQNETALSPSDFTFSNGSREINTGEGTIEEMNSIIFSLFAGVRYDAYSFDNWTIRPELKYNYVPGSILDGKDLNVSQISGSLSLVYHVTESTSPPPPPPPMPEVKEPVIVEAIVPPHIDVKLEMKDELGNNIVDGQIVNIPTTLFETRQEYALRPVVFFDSSDYNYKQYNIQSFTNSDFDVQTQMIKAISDRMNADESLTVMLTAYEIGDEERDIPQLRTDNIKQKLMEYGVPASKISNKIEKVENDFKYNELKNEFRKVDLTLSDNSDLIKSIYEIQSKVEYNDVTFIPKSTITTTGDEYDAESNLYLNGDLTKNGKLDFNFILGYAMAKKFEKTGNIEVEYRSNAQVSGIYADDKISFTLKPKINTVNQTINTVNNGSDVSEQHILGYTEFDKSSFKSIDNDVLNLVRKAIKDNKKIIIYASTDNLGNEEYNKALAERRANATKNLIGSDNSNISVVYPKEYLFSNEHPYGRMLNRAIVVRIDN